MHLHSEFPVCVELAPVSRSSALFPHYDYEVNILDVSSRVERKWPYGVNVGGCLIFDFDQDRILCNLELLTPRRLWRADSRLRLPQRAGAVGIRIRKASLRHKTFQRGKIDVRYSQASSLLRVGFWECGSDARVYSLSDECYAVLSGHILCGFYVVVAVR